MPVAVDFFLKYTFLLNPMSKKSLSVFITIFLLMIFLPYLLAWGMSGKDFVFNGFLLNPIDGNSYLAKMYEGWSGEWKFTLPYTVDAGEGAYLFLFYLFLGHLSRWTSIPNQFLFHAIRMVGAGVLGLSIAAFCNRIFKDHPGYVGTIIWLTAFGSGLGWLVVFGGLLPSDFWVAEAYPFLSAYSNPHFPLGLAALMGILLLKMEDRKPWHIAIYLGGGLFLSVVLPFGLVVAGVILGGILVWEWVEDRPFQGAERSKRFWLGILPLVGTMALGGPLLLYQFWVSMTDPVVSGWNAQNLTPSPPLWDFFLSFSPALLLAIPGAWQIWRNKTHPARRLLLTWFFAGLVLIYLPFSLQRRFILGFYIPTAALAGFGLMYFKEKMKERGRWLAPVLLGLSLMTNILLILGALLNVMGHSNQIYLSRGEYQALQWIIENSPSSAVIVCSPQMGSYIPAWTGRRVIYGHPFETVNARVEEQAVEEFFRGTMTAVDAQSWLEQKRGNYVFWGKREQKLAEDLSSWEAWASRALDVIYQEDSVTIYEVRKSP